MHILVCNTGSSSLKFSLFEAKGERLLAEGGIDWATTPTRLVCHCPGQPEVREELTLRHHADAIARLLDALQAGPAAPCRHLAMCTPSATASCTAVSATPPPCVSHPR